MRVILPKPSNSDHQDQEQGEELHISLYLSYSYYFYEMTDPIHINWVKLRKDEYDIDFECVISILNNMC